MDKTYVARRVIVNTAAAVIDGTLARITRLGDLVLVEASAVAEDGGRTPIDGEVIVPAGRVLWVQVP